MQIYAAARATVQQCIFATLPRHHCGRHRGRAGARRGRLGVEEEEKSHTVFIFLCIYCADRLFCVPQTSNRHGGGEPLDRSDRPKGGRRRVNLILVSRTWGGGRRRTRRAPRGRKNEVNATTARPPAGGGGGIIDEAARLDWPGSDEGPRRAPVFFLVQSNCFYFFVHRLLGI